MSTRLVSDELWAVGEPLLPVEAPKSHGDRRRLSDRAALMGIVFVLKSGLGWELLPQEMGVWKGDDVLAACAGFPPPYTVSQFLVYAQPNGSRWRLTGRPDRTGERPKAQLSGHTGTG